MDELRKWIYDGLTKGYSRDQLRGILIQQGYDQYSIDNAFNPPANESEAISRKIVHEKKKKNLNKFYFLIGGVILLLIIGVFAWIFVGDNAAVNDTTFGENNIDDNNAGIDTAESSDVQESDSEIYDPSIEYREIEEEKYEGQLYTIVIDEFIGEPTDLDIKVGDSVEFVNEQRNFKHIIGIREWIDGEFEKAPIDDYNPIVTGESYLYKFERTGQYLWFSKANYPRTSGEIIVT